MEEKKILIGMPSGSGYVPTITVQSLLQLIKPLPCGFMTVEKQRIDRARNAIVMETLTKGFDYLFFVDDDNPIPPNTLVQFLEDDKDIVGAPILGRNADKEGKHPLCAFYKKAITIQEQKINLYYNIDVFKEEGPLHKVDAIGCGCLLIKRRVLEVLHFKYKDYVFEFGDIKFSEKTMIDGKEFDRRTMSEDCEFSERVVDVGFEIWLDERIRPLHMSSTNFIQWS